MPGIVGKADLSQFEKKYKKYFDIFESKSMKAKANLRIDESDLLALGHQLQTFENWVSFKEANGSVDDLGIVPKIGLDVIAAAQATSVIPVIAGVQPLDERKGLVWFKNIVSRSTRGGIQAGQTLLSGKEGRKVVADEFAGEMIYGEVAGKGDGETKEFNLIAKYAPLRKRYTKITVSGTDVVIIDDGQGNLIGVGGKGTVNYQTGSIDVTFDNAPADGAEILLDYGSNFEVFDEIQTIGSEYESVEVTARNFALRTEIGLFKSYEMSKRFKIDVEEVLARDLVTEMTTQLSTATVRTLDAGVGTAAIEWDKTPPDGVSFMEHMLSFEAALAEAENRILDKTGRLGENVVYIVGTKAASVFRILPGFKAAEAVKATLGTHLYGFYNGNPVIRSIAIAADEVIVETRGNDNYETPVIYAPYMPLFVTDSFHGMDHNPLNAQKAAAAMVGIKSVIPGLAQKIKILNS